MARSRAPVWSPGHGWSPSPDHISLSPSLWDHEQEGGHQNPKERELSCLSADSEAGILLPTLHSQRDGTCRLVWPMSRTHFPRRAWTKSWRYFSQKENPGAVSRRWERGRDQAETVGAQYQFALSQGYFTQVCHRYIKDPNLAGHGWEVEIKLNLLKPHGKQRDILTLSVPRRRTEIFPEAWASYLCSSHGLEDTTWLRGPSFLLPMQNLGAINSSCHQDSTDLNILSLFLDQHQVF